MLRRTLPAVLCFALLTTACADPLGLPSSRVAASAKAPSALTAAASAATQNTTFAIFFELSDLSTLVGTARAPSLSPDLRNRVTQYWNGGLKDWDTAPVGSAPGDCCCPLCRRVVISGGSLGDFANLLDDIAAFFGTKEAEYLTALANEIRQPQGGVEPWPPAP